jgi:hypothetical protein
MVQKGDASRTGSPWRLYAEILKYTGYGQASESSSTFLCSKTFLRYVEQGIYGFSFENDFCLET